MIIEAAAQRTRDVAEQRQQAGWIQTGIKWNPPDGSTEDADWKSLRAKWAFEAKGSSTDDGLVPTKLIRGYVSEARRADGAQRLQRFSSHDQNGTIGDDKTIAEDEGVEAV